MGYCSHDREPVFSSTMSCFDRVYRASKEHAHLWHATRNAAPPLPHPFSLLSPPSPPVGVSNLIRSALLLALVYKPLRQISRVRVELLVITTEPFSCLHRLTAPTRTQYSPKASIGASRPVRTEPNRTEWNRTERIGHGATDLTAGLSD